MYKDLYSENMKLDVKGKGQVLTPDFIVDYMVKESVDRAYEQQVDKTKPLAILDPASGTGRFMLGVADYCGKNNINFVMWNIDIDEKMFDATVAHAVHYKIPAVVILGNALLNEFQKAVGVKDGIVEEIDIQKITKMFQDLSNRGKPNQQLEMDI